MVLRRDILDAVERNAKALSVAAHLDLALDMLRDTQQIAQQLRNGGIRVGLEKIVKGMDRERLPDIIAGGGDEDKREARRELAQALRRLDPVHPGHENIEKYGVISRRRGALQQRVAAFEKAKAQLAEPRRRALQRAAQRLRVRRDVLCDREV